jgi:hypothetical protein
VDGSGREQSGPSPDAIRLLRGVWLQ